MTPLIVALAPGPALLAQAAEAVDIGWLQAFGAAAPFAALCFWQMNRAQKKQDEAEAKHAEECAKRDAEISRLHGRIEEQAKEALQREQQLVAGLGPRIYDAALLYREATGLAEQVSTPPRPVAPPAAPPDVDRRLDELTATIEQLVKGMGQQPG